MGPISVKADIDVPRERVFVLLTDLSLRPAFTDHFISGYRLAREQPVGVGAAARMGVGAPGGIEHMVTEIQETDPPHRIVERGRGGRLDRVPISTVWELTEGAAGTTSVTLTFWTEPRKPLDKLRELRAAGWWRRRWSRALQRLAEIAESGEPAPARVGVAGADRIPVWG